MKNIRLFHLLEPNYEQIVTEIENSKRRNILQESVTVYEGAGRYAILSSDDEIDFILSKAGCKELSKERLMVNAIATEPEVFHFHYGNKNLAEMLS
jgi:hypothetical protein